MSNLYMCVHINIYICTHDSLSLSLSLSLSFCVYMYIYVWLEQRGLLSSHGLQAGLGGLAGWSTVGAVSSVSVAFRLGWLGLCFCGSNRGWLVWDEGIMLLGFEGF